MSSSSVTTCGLQDERIPTYSTLIFPLFVSSHVCNPISWVSFQSVFYYQGCRSVSTFETCSQRQDTTVSRHVHIIQFDPIKSPLFTSKAVNVTAKQFISILNPRLNTFTCSRSLSWLCYYTVGFGHDVFIIALRKQWDKGVTHVNALNEIVYRCVPWEL